MATKRSFGGKRKGRFVRLYYRFDIATVFPEPPARAPGRKGKSPSASHDWNAGRADDLALEVGNLLGDAFDGVVVDRCEQIDARYGLHVVTLVTAFLREFPADAFSGPSSRMKGSALKAADQEIAGAINEALTPVYRLRGLERILVASRNFGFEFTCSGQLVVDCEFTNEYVREAGGILAAFDDLERRMIEAGSNINVDMVLTSPRRRRADNRYVFDVFHSRVTGFGEHEVVGDVVSMYREESAPSAGDFDLELTAEAYVRGATFIKEDLASALSTEMNYPLGVEFAGLTGVSVDSDQVAWDSEHETNVGKRPRV